MWMWSGHASASIISPLFARIASLVSVLSLPVVPHILFVYGTLAQILRDIDISFWCVLNYSSLLSFEGLLRASSLAVGEPAFILAPRCLFSIAKAFLPTSSAGGSLVSQKEAELQHNYAKNRAPFQMLFGAGNRTWICRIIWIDVNWCEFMAWFYGVFESMTMNWNRFDVELW